MDALLIDADEFCRLKESRNGECAVADLPRLAQEASGRAGSIRWSLVGGTNHLGYRQLALAITGSVQLTCQRCLTSFDFRVDSSSVLVLADDEASADHMETILDDESIEVIVAPRQFNVTDLVEDEALLALPVSPKHDLCPDQSLIEQAPSGERKASPFDALKNWKR